MKSLDRRLSALESTAPPADQRAADAFLRALTDDELERLEGISTRTDGDADLLSESERSWLISITEAHHHAHD